MKTSSRFFSESTDEEKEEDKRAHTQRWSIRFLLKNRAFSRVASGDRLCTRQEAVGKCKNWRAKQQETPTGVPFRDAHYSRKESAILLGNATAVRMRLLRNCAYLSYASGFYIN